MQNLQDNAYKYNTEWFDDTMIKWLIYIKVGWSFNSYIGIYGKEEVNTDAIVTKIGLGEKE